MVLMQGMSQMQMMMFQSEMARRRKSVGAAVALTFFLGAFGAHRFYMGQVGVGLLYAMFFWTFIPSIIAFVELFLISGRVERHNTEQASEVAAQVRMLAANNPR
jgi:TM2 domain-containing membrane protein YozV